MPYTCTAGAREEGGREGSHTGEELTQENGHARGSTQLTLTVGTEEGVQPSIKGYGGWRGQQHNAGSMH